MKKYHIFIIINLLHLYSYAAEKPIVQDAKEIERIIEKNSELAKEAQKKAYEAEQAEMTAKTEKEKYKTIMDDTSLPAEKQEAARTEYIIWGGKEQEYAKTKIQEQTKANDLITDNTKLTQSQQEVQKEFTAEPTPETNILKEQFESCIKSDILTLFQSQKLQNLNSPQMIEYMKELSQQLADLTQYERTNFYQSYTYTEQQWKQIHNDVLQNPNKYDPRYRKLIQSLNELKKKIEANLKQNNIEIPTTANTDRCFVKIYADVNAKIIKMEKLMGKDIDSSIIWD